LELVEDIDAFVRVESGGKWVVGVLPWSI